MKHSTRVLTTALDLLFFPDIVTNQPLTHVPIVCHTQCITLRGDPPVPVHLLILGLAWDETTEEHINNRLATDELEDFIQRGQYLVFPNTAGHPPGRYKLIGTMPSGLLWTVILEEAADRNPEHWKPITAFRSSAMKQKSSDVK